MEITQQYLQELKDNLSKLDPYLVLLFGSYAYGSPHADSDLDIMVVLNDYTIPASFKEKQSLYLKVSPYTRSVAKKVPVDLIVYTIPMYENFRKIRNGFSEEVLEKGIILYESKHTPMA
jgi:uncharacterized protein